MKRYLAVVAVILLSIPLSACAGSVILVRDQSPEPAPTAGYAAQTQAGIITVTWPTDSSELALTSVGSSSCPFVPRNFEGDDDRTLVMARDTGGADNCSADLSPTTSTIARPPAWEAGAQVDAVTENDLIMLTVRPIGN